MYILTKFDYLEKRDSLEIYEVNCGKDNVDRSDYTSPEEQYYRLILSGIQLKRSREYMYDFDSELAEYKTSRLFERYMDKLDTVEKYRQKMRQYNDVKSQNERIKALHEQYLEEMKQIENENKIRHDLNKKVSEAVKKD